MSVTPSFINQVGGHGGVAAEGKKTRFLTEGHRRAASAANKDRISADPRATYIPGHGATALKRKSKRLER